MATKGTAVAKAAVGGQAGGGGGAARVPQKRKIGAALQEKAKFGKKPYASDWETFENEAKRMFQRNPNNVRASLVRAQGSLLRARGAVVV